MAQQTGGRQRYRLCTAPFALLVAYAPAACAQAMSGEPAGGASSSVGASTDPRDAKIRALESRIDALALELRELKRMQESSIKEIPAAAATPAPARVEVGITNARPQINSADGRFKFAVRGVGQFDAAEYKVRPLTAANDLASGTDIRRARLGVDGSAFGVWNFSLWGEFGGSGNEAAGLNQAFIEYAGFKPFAWADPIRLRAGAWATPVGLEDATPNTELLFLERPAVEEMVRGLDAGDGREGVGLFATGPRWYVSAVLTGKTAGAGAGIFNQQEGFVTRAAVNPFHGKDYDLHLGASMQGVLRPADTLAGPAKGYAISLAQQPELRVDDNGVKLVSTGALTADRQTTYGAEIGVSFHNVYFAGEYFWLTVDRTAVGPAASPFNPHVSGWYLQGAWTLTGEHRSWSSSNGGFRGIVKPRRDFDPAAGGWGAVELAARYSVLDLNDQPGLAGVATPFGGVRGGEQKIATFGLNWYPNSVIRFLFDYQHGVVRRLTATGASADETLDDLSLRAQFAF